MDRARTSDEFPHGSSDWPSNLNRREFLKLSTVAIALSGLGGCTRKLASEIVPYVTRPEEYVRSNRLEFATSAVYYGLATGLIARSDNGYPTKLDGNPAHPASFGGTLPWHQAELFSLYTPHRSKKFFENGKPTSLQGFTAFFNSQIPAWRKRNGEGIHILTELSSSPTLQRQITQLKHRFPKLEWTQYEPLHRTYAEDAAEKVFGRRLIPIYDIKATDVIVSLDSDILRFHPAALKHIREFSQRRRSNHGRNKLLMAECSPTLTGANADKRVSVSSRELHQLALAILREFDPKQKGKFAESLRPDLQIFLKEIKAVHKANLLFIAGEQQPQIIHEICHHLNFIRRAKTLHYIEPVLKKNSGLEPLKTLVEKMHGGAVDTLLIFGGNPVLNAPADFQFQKALQNVRHSLRFGLYNDETAMASHWRIPLAHPWETWSDARAFDGTQSVVQPLLISEFPVVSLHETLALLSGEPNDALSLVKETWKREIGAWNEILAMGFLSGSEAKIVNPGSSRFSSSMEIPPAEREGVIEVFFRPDETLWDGRFRENVWLQELPKPLTKLSWSTGALAAPSFLKQNHFAKGQEILLENFAAPIWPQPGHTANALTLSFGSTYNTYTFWQSTAPDNTFVTWRKSEKKSTLISAQDHFHLDHGEEVRMVSGDNPNPKRTTAESFFPNPPIEPSPDYQWGMVIDLNRCVGCAACVVACQVENNIPSVGPEAVSVGREMHWIRIDRSFSGDLENPHVSFQPLPCMHCEKAPCEPVCPVGATLHNTQGINQMIYNRCVGTRYCSNNCPYKVRRFNFLAYNKPENPDSQVKKNPEVTVRFRGVMEKCTYCIQRINHATIDAQKENRKIREGEVRTACQEACPAEAIVFGNLKDENSEVKKLRGHPWNYSVLETLGTIPRTTYLAKFKETAEPHGS